MFGLSLTKILLIVLVAAVLWYGFKAIRRRDARRAEGRGGRGHAPSASGTETMVKCTVCGTYNPPGVTCTHRQS